MEEAAWLGKVVGVNSRCSRKLAAVGSLAPTDLPGNFKGAP